MQPLMIKGVAMKLKLFGFCLGLLLLPWIIISCGRSGDQATMRVGVMAGPEADLMQVAKQVAKKQYKLNIEIIEFTDYTIPNAALNEGSIDANAFQHLPYLEAAIEANGYDITAIGRTFIYPIGVYSEKIEDLSDLQDNATVAIPNDPSNEARALILLEEVDLITLDPNAGVTATPSDIKENSMNLRFLEIDAAQLPRALADVDIAVINSTYAVPAGLLPNRDAIYIEGKESKYANLIVARTAEKDDEQLHQLVEAYHSQAVIDKAVELFDGGAIPAWR